MDIFAKREAGRVFAQQAAELVFALSAHKSEYQAETPHHVDLLVERYTMLRTWGALHLDATYEAKDGRMVLNAVQLGATELDSNNPLEFEVNLTPDSYLKQYGFSVNKNTKCKRVFSENGYIMRDMHEKMMSRINDGPSDVVLLAQDMLYAPARKYYAESTGIFAPFYNLFKDREPMPDIYPEAFKKLKDKLNALSEDNLRTVQQIITGQDMYLLADYEDGYGADLQVIHSKDYNTLKSVLALRDWGKLRKGHNQCVLGAVNVPADTDIIALTLNLPKCYADENVKVGDHAVLAFKLGSGTPTCVRPLGTVMEKWMRSHKSDVVMPRNEVVRGTGTGISMPFNVSAPVLAAMLEKFWADEPAVVVVAERSDEYRALHVLSNLRPNIKVICGRWWNGVLRDSADVMRDVATVAASMPGCKAFTMKELMFAGAQLLTDV